MSKTGGPDLKKYLDKKLAFKLNGNRKVRGCVWGGDGAMMGWRDRWVWGSVGDERVGGMMGWGRVGSQGGRQAGSRPARGASVGGLWFGGVEWSAVILIPYS